MMSSPQHHPTSKTSTPCKGNMSSNPQNKVEVNDVSTEKSATKTTPKVEGNKENPNEAETPKSKIDSVIVTPDQVSFSDYYTFVTHKHMILMAFQVIGEMCCSLTTALGLCILLYALIILYGAPQGWRTLPEETFQFMAVPVITSASFLCLCVVGKSFSKYVQLRVGFIDNGEKWRSKYFKSVLKQKMGYFDKNNPIAVSQNVNKDIDTIIEVIAQLPVMLGKCLALVLVLIFVAFLGPVFFALAIFSLLNFVFSLHKGRKHAMMSAQAFEQSEANVVAEEVLKNIKTVQGATAEKDIIEKYLYLTNKNSSLEQTHAIKSSNYRAYGLLQFAGGFHVVLFAVALTFSLWWDPRMLEWSAFNKPSNKSGPEINSI